MKKYIAILEKTIQTECAFESTDVMTGNKIEVYKVPMTLTSGPRQFKTKIKAIEWVNLMNTTYGQGAARMEG